MEKKIISRFTPVILAEIASRYGLLPDQLEILDGFESFIFRFERDAGRYILRVSHSSRRSEAWIRGEVDWINYLVSGGVSASQVISSKQGNLVEAAADGHGEFFIGTVFVHAPGKPPWEIGWTDQLYQNLGQTIGRMHALTKVYSPQDPLAFRPQWDDPIMLLGEDWLPSSEALVEEKYQKVLEWCRTLPKDRENYGLIHFDAHEQNYFLDEAGIPHLFDFDDCTYNWFANDIAMVLFYIIMGEKNLSEFIPNFISQFIRGYNRENQFREEWLEWMPGFMKMREIELYGIFHRDYDVHHLENAWDIRYMDGRREKIVQDVPYLDFDFSTLSSFLS
ncbi:phosphotransferase [bacterium]|nr:phosphotransferase [bacterium]MCB2179315.1 phosphotransferase [bacterium]